MRGLQRVCNIKIRENQRFSGHKQNRRFCCAENSKIFSHQKREAFFSVLLSTGPIKSKAYLLESVRKLAEMKFNLYATEGTAKFLEQNEIKTTLLHWPLDKKEPNTLTYIQERKIDLVINIPKSLEEEELTNDYLIRRKAVDFNIPLLTNAQAAKLFIESIHKKKMEDLEVKEWGEY